MSEVNNTLNENFQVQGNNQLTPYQNNYYENTNNLNNQQYPQNNNYNNQPYMNNENIQNNLNMPNQNNNASN